MGSGSRMDGSAQALPYRLRKTIQSIKEVVGNHSDSDIYAALEEANMDPNETTQKLLNQDPFHEVKRRRDRKKESQSVGYKGTSEPQSRTENKGRRMKFHVTPERASQRINYSRNTLPGISREFRVVRDNRANHIYKEVKPPSVQCSTSTNEQLNSSEKGSSADSSNKKSSVAIKSSQVPNGPSESHTRYSGDTVSDAIDRQGSSEEKQVMTPDTALQSQPVKPSNVHQNSVTVASSSSAVGVYSSSTDPVHVPSPDSRSSGAVGAIGREVGLVGVRRHSSDNSLKQSSVPSSSYANSLVGKDVSRSFLSNQYNNRQHQQSVGHQRVSQHNKEWKPKLSQKLNVSGPGVIGAPTKPVSPAEKSEDVESDTAKLEDKLSQLNIFENQNVIIAKHIRVPETDRCQLTFGTIGTGVDSSRLQPSCQPIGTAEKSNEESVASMSVPAPELTSDVSGSNQVDLQDDHIQSTGSDSPASAAEQQLLDNKESSRPHNLDNYADIGLVHDNRMSYTPSESQQQQDSHDMPGFSAYDPPTGYDIPYLRQTTDETVRVQGLPSAQEGYGSHNSNNISTSTIPMVQQQPPVAQMYPQVHVSHFSNLMPFRQFLSPVYVPPMPMTGYSSNPPYPHPSNGSSYLLMPGGSSHLNANSIKYGVQQFKPVPSGSPTGFGNFTNPTGYAMNAPGMVGGATALEDSSRIKYKDNLYVPNPQAETSEIWIQNPRELSSMQSPQYYNMPGQTPHHAAYMPSHAGHASFNAAAAQSSHMQFPGMYHASPQPGAMASPHHHLGPVMGNNVGVGVAAAAPGAQVGAYQQPQMGHLNWTTNF